MEFKCVIFLGKSESSNCARREKLNVNERRRAPVKQYHEPEKSLRNFTLLNVTQAFLLPFFKCELCLLCSFFI